MIDNQDLKRNAYNKKRYIIYCAAGMSTPVVAIIILILLSFITDETGVLILAIAFVLYLIIACSIMLHISTYEHPIYGKFNLVDEFNHARKYKYTSENMNNLIKQELIKDNFLETNYSSNLLKGTYFYKQEKTNYHIVLFIEQKITEEIYKDYTKNYLCGFIDTLADEGKIENWKSLYISIIIQQDKENEYTEKFLNYNLELPQNIGFMPILIDEKKKELEISNFDFGPGLTEYGEMKRKFLRKFDQYIIKNKRKSKKKEVTNS